MKLPEKNRKWLREIKLAYSKAEKEAVRENIDQLELYRLAAKYVAKNRRISNPEIIENMVQWGVDEVAHGKGIEPGSEENYKFHFVSAYIHSHHVAKLMSEMECDRVLEYVNYEWDLFPNK